MCLRRNTETSEGESGSAERENPSGRFPRSLTILANLCASVTRSISNMTSSSTVGYSGSFLAISCSIRWNNSTSYLQKNNKRSLITLNAKQTRQVLVSECARKAKMWKSAIIKIWAGSNSMSARELKWVGESTWEFVNKREFELSSTVVPQLILTLENCSTDNKHWTHCVTKVIERPERPALAVRPTRWI